jgi:hypothetical protein
MKQRVIVITVLIVVIAIAVPLVVLGPNFLSPAPISKGQTTTNQNNQQTIADTLIARENMQQGSTDWQIPDGRVARTEIQAYVDARSIAPGKQLTFYVSTRDAGTHYNLAIYRLGWYQGTGARLMTVVPALTGQAQGYYDDDNSKLINCRTCYVDTQTGLIEARWQPSYKLTIPSDWISGLYLAKFTDAQGYQTYTSFDVLGNPTSAYVAVTADTTYAAYNNWGGRGLYDYNSIEKKPAVKVSFLRPSTQGNGADQALMFEANAVRWMERNGYDLSYISSVDLHTHPEWLLKHKAYIALGHDEYWSKEMRNGVEAARDHGVGLAFLESDDSYWQIRFEPSSTGSPNQTVVGYKVLTDQHDLNRDPLYGKDNSRVTTQWRDPVVNRPENALVGIMFSDLTHKQKGYAWKFATSTHSDLLRDVNLEQGKAYGCGLVGYEWDKVFNNGSTPRGLQILATSPTITDDGKQDSSNTTYYIAPSKAMVFATGSIYWTSALDEYRFSQDATCSGQAPVIAGMQQLMKNVMAALIVPHQPPA